MYATERGERAGPEPRSTRSASGTATAISPVSTSPRRPGERGIRRIPGRVRIEDGHRVREVADRHAQGSGLGIEPETNDVVGPGHAEAVGESLEVDADRALVRPIGISVAEAKRGRSVTVSLDLIFHSLTAEELERKLRAGGPLSLTEIAYLRRSGSPSERELATCLVDDGRIQARVTDF